MTVGEKNNNPLNVKQGSDPWKGSVEPRRSDERGHAIFKSVEWGVRAAIRTLARYQLAHGLLTLASIIERWAPRTDTQGSLPGRPANEPGKYAIFVADWIGTNPDDKLLLFNPNGEVKNAHVLYAVMRAMSIYENGHAYDLPWESFLAGVTRYNESWGGK